MINILIKKKIKKKIMEKTQKMVLQKKKDLLHAKPSPLINIILIPILSGSKNHINQEQGPIIWLIKPKRNLILIKY